MTQKIAFSAAKSRRLRLQSITKAFLLGTSASVVLAVFSPACASTLLDFTTTGNVSAWSKTGSATTTSYPVYLTLGTRYFSLAPAAGQYMARISPSGSALSSAEVDNRLHLTAGTIDTALTGVYGQNLSKNYGILSEAVALTPGTYTFYWSYAANDYNPYFDGVLFALSNATHSVNDVSILATVGPVPNAGNTVVLGDYGATQWAAYSFNIATSDTYNVSFASYNWKDTSQNPTLFIGDAAGTVVEELAHPIDTNAPYYLASKLGTTVKPEFKGGTLRVDASGVISSAFTVGTYTGNAIDAYGNVGIFSGVMSGGGGLTIKDSVGGGQVVFSGNNTYSGATTVNAGATLQIGVGETTGSVAGSITDNGTLIFNRSDAITYAGVVSGTGSLTQAGSGTLILTGANIYSGGTLISSGTLQLGNGGTSGSIIGDVVNNGTFAYNRSDSIAFSGAISGTGNLVKQGAGTLILAGANTYAGGTTIAAGTLQIGSGGTTGSVAGNIVNNAALAFNRSNTLSYSGVISGPGSVSVSGGGAVVLTGNSTYTGLTSIAAGSILQLGNGGTTGSIVSDVVNQGVLAFNRSDTVTFTGNVTGDGTLVQNGTGKVIVTTNYTGKTIVNSGTLQIGNGSTSGTVTGNIVNNATVVYGQAAATTYTGIISGSGGVSVAGGGVVILNGSNTYTGPTTVTAGSLIVGDSTHPSAMVLGGVTVSGNAVVGGYGMIGGNLAASGGIVSPGNSIGTLTVAGNYTQSASSTLSIEVSPAASDKLVVGGTAQLGGTLAISLAPGNYGTRSLALVTAGSISGTFAAVNYTGASTGMVYGIVYAPTEVDLAMAPKASGQIYGDLVTESLDTAVVLNRATLERLSSATDKGWTVWSRPLAGASRTTNSENVAEFNSQLWGVIGGVDYGFGDGTRLTGVFSYTHNLVSVSGENDKAYADGYFFAVAGHMPVKAFSVDVTGFVQHNVIDVVRLSGGATSHTTNLVGGGSLQVGYPMAAGDVLPFARLTMASLDAGSFNEAQSAGLALGISDTSHTAVRGTLGIEATHVFTTSNGTELMPRLMLGIEEEFGGRSRALRMTFAGTPFASPAATPAPLSILLGTGLTAKMNSNLDLHVGLNGRISSNQREGILDLGVRYAF